MIAPLGFSTVSQGLYRSALPAKKTLPFIRSLRLKSMVCLSPGAISPELQDWCSKQNVALVCHDIGFNQEPFVTVNPSCLQECVLFASTLINYPCLVFCLNGKARSSLVVACLRRSMNWSLVSIIHEYELFTQGENTSVIDLSCIEEFS